MFFSPADLGWVVGHTMITYGPLIRRMTSILFEGKPAIPDAGILWKICEEKKVDHFFTAPTAIRELVKLDNDGAFIKKYDTSCVGVFQVVGERCDADTMWWMRKQFSHCIVNDTWWHTESGWPVGSNMLNQDVFGPVYPTLPGSITKASPGWDVRVINEEGQEAERGQLGKVCMKLPTPPSHTLTLWGNDQGYVDKYLTDVPGFFNTGDEGMIDERGYIHILSRMDDVINVAGHRLDTGRLEEPIGKHEEIVESAVVGIDDKLKGQVPVALVILRDRSDGKVMSAEERQTIVNEINYKIRSEVGAFARLEGALFIPRMPKTRSGKILRRIMRNILNDQPYKFPATIDDATTLDHIHTLS